MICYNCRFCPHDWYGVKSFDNPSILSPAIAYEVGTKYNAVFKGKIASILNKEIESNYNCSPFERLQVRG